MGLDSVELLMTIEDEFGIGIPDAECEQIATIQDMANSVFEKIKVTPNKKCLSQIVFYRIRKAFEQFENKKCDITPNTRMSELLNEVDLKNEWKRLENIIGLKIPDLVDFNKEVRFLGFKIFDRTEPVLGNTLRKFTDWIISMNYKKLIFFDNISSKYEIERIICAIIEDKMVIPVSEVELYHSFVNDLGMD